MPHHQPLVPASLLQSAVDYADLFISMWMTSFSTTSHLYRHHERRLRLTRRLSHASRHADVDTLHSMQA